MGYLLALLALVGTVVTWDRRRSRTPRWWGLVAATGICGAAFGYVARSDYVLQKIIGWLLMPMGLIWLVIVFVTVAEWVGRRPRRAIPWTIALVAFTAIGNMWLGTRLIGAVERLAPSVLPTEIDRLDAIFVLGGGTKLGPGGYPELGSVGDRVMLGARMFKTGKTDTLVTSGSSIPGLHTARDLSAETARIWTDLGIPDSAIVRLPEPINTSQEVAAYKALIEERGWKSVGLLSSAWHLPRILRSCRRHGLKVTPIAADHRSGDMKLTPGVLVPHASGLLLIHRAAWELVGMAAGR